MAEAGWAAGRRKTAQVPGFSALGHKPLIHFFRRHDGQRIAYAVHGQGPPLVCPAWWVSHLEEDWKEPGFREFFSRLAGHRTVIRYDRVGCGLSDRERQYVDLAGEVALLSDLIDHLELERLALLALSCAAPPALTYAAAQPGRVSHLVLFGAFARGGDVGPPALKAAMQSLVRAHWGIGSRTITDLLAPDLPTPDAMRLSRSHRKAASGEMAARLLALTFDVDVAHVASTVATPSMVIHRADDRTIRHEAGRKLATILPNASFMTLTGNAHVPWLGDQQDALDAVLRFLGHRSDEAAPAASEVGNRLARSGDVWTAVFAGRSAHVKHARGMTDLAMLLLNAGRDVHVAELWSGAGGSAPLPGGNQPMLDDEALRSYRSRLRAIDAESSAAELQDDTAHADRLEGERVALTNGLRAALGLGGRKRGLAEPTERARKAVSARIRGSIRKISKVHPELGAHLQQSITTGIYCTYDTESDVAWSIEDGR